MVKKIGILLKQAEKLEKHILLESIISAILECFSPFIPLFGIAYVIEGVLKVEYDHACYIFISTIILKSICAYFISCLFFNITQKKQLLFTDFRIHIKDIYLRFSYDKAQSNKIKDAMNSIDYNCFMYGGLEEIVSITQRMYKNGLTIIISGISIYTLAIKKCTDYNDFSYHNIIVFLGSMILLILFSIFALKAANVLVDKEEKLYDEHRSTEKSLNYYMGNFFGDSETIQTIQQFNMYKLIYHKVNEGVKKSITLFSKIRDFRLYEKICHSTVNYLLSLFFYGLLVYKTYYGAITIGDFSFYYGVIITVSFAIAEFIDDRAKICIAISRFDDYFLLCDCMKNIEKDDSIKKSELTDDSEICIKNVSYKYEGSDKNVLNNINLVLHKNEKVAIVGPNGAGKSTLVNCICGLLPVTEGEIQIGKENIRNISPLQKKEFFGTVFQDYAYFPFTLGENISLQEEYNRDNVINLLNSLNLNDKTIADYTNIDARVSLSGGQKQKVAVSRARYKKHSCYILDEPSASMDILSEQILYEEYGKITNGKLCIFVSHRMASCIKADRIIVMNNGSIIDIGTHVDLLNRCELYRTMWNKQTEHYVKKRKV